MYPSHPGTFQPMQFDVMTYNAIIKRQLVAVTTVITMLMCFVQVQDECRKASAQRGPAFSQVAPSGLVEHCADLICKIANPV